MATLALGLVGSALGPSMFGATAFSMFGNAVTGAALGGFIFSTAGSLIDNFVIFPLLFPPPNQQGPRLTDMQYSGAQEGTELAWSIGSRVRAGCQVLWFPLREDGQPDWVERETEQGGKGGGPTSTTFTYYLDLAVELTETDGYAGVDRLMQLFGDSKVIYADGEVNLEFVEEVTFYDGTQTTADVLIESYEGAGNVPAFKDVSYAVLKMMALDPFGRRIPNWTGTLSTQRIMHLDEAVGAIMRRAQFDDSEFNVELLETICFRGVTLTGPQATNSGLQPLMTAYAVNAQEVDGGVVRFVPRGLETEFEVSDGDLAAAVLGEEDSERWRFLERDVDDQVLPGQATVRYYNADTLKLEQGAEPYARSNWSGREQQTTMDVPVSLTSSEASGLAMRVVTVSEEERQAVELSLMPWYWYAQAGDVAIINRRGVQRRVYLIEVNIGRNGIVKCRGFYAEKESYSNDGVRTPVPSTPTTVTRNEHVEMNGPPLLAAVAGLVGLYTGAEVRGALYKSSDRSDWTRVTSIERSAAIGTIVSPPSSDPPIGVFDLLDSMTVKLTGDRPPASCTIDACLSGTNRLLIEHPTGESEVIGFTTVNDDVVDDQYVLSGLIRGLNGTEHLVANHAAGAKCMSVRRDAGTTFIEVALGLEQYYRATVFGQTVTNARPTYSQTCNGQSARPFSPSHVQCSVDSLDSLNVTWLRRSRVPTTSLAPGPASGDETGYVVEVHLYNPESPARLSKSTTALEVTFTTDELTAAGVDPNEAKVRVYMIGTTSGRSAPGRGGT